VVPVETEKGHIFVEEGKEMTMILILEEGVLVRTKLSVSDADVPEVRKSLRRMSAGPSKHQEIIDNSCVVDHLQGRGRVSGLLHSCAEDALSFATVSAFTTPTKVWLLDSQDFRTIVSHNPQNCIDVLAALSRELRVGSKSLRGLIQKVKSATGQDDDDDKIGSKKVLKVLCYDSTSWVIEGFKPAIKKFNEKQKLEQGDKAVKLIMDFTTERLGEQSATYAAGYSAVCLFVNDLASEKVFQTLSLMGVTMVAMRCAGFDRVDCKAATVYGMTVARVPAYSPYAVAEMAVALLMAVNRKISRASARVKMANFTLDAGLMGMDIYGKTVGILGTGKIGQILCKIMLGFGAKLLCYDVYQSQEVIQMGGEYVEDMDEIYQQCDIIFLMMPLFESTYHTINKEAIQKMKQGVLIINTSRGGLVDTKALLQGMQDGIIGGVGMDVYEHEQAYFFQDWSARHIKDPDLLALIGENNVVMTAHQAFFTKEAVDKIVETTLDNLCDFANGLTGQKHPNNCIPASK
jgi:D-lactate dehydrogenase